MAKRIEHINHYFIVTDTITGIKEIEYPTKDIFYRDSPDAIDIVYKFDRATMIVMQKADIVDHEDNPFPSEAVLLNFLRLSTGSEVSVDVAIQDQHSPIIIAKLSNVENETLLLNPVAIGDRDIVVVSASGIGEGDYMSMFDIASNRFYVGYAILVVGTTITLDSPIDFAYPAGSFVTSGVADMSVDGSVTPVIYGLRNTTQSIGITADITRVIFTVLTSSAPTYATFGDIAALVNGIVLRKVDGSTHNIFNLKTNGELQGIMYDLAAADAVNPNQGQNGFVARLTFASPGKIGVTVRLAPGEDLQMIIQDDLTDIQLFELVCEGHEVVGHETLD